ncbi:Hypothetical predicted protein [Podarcis lilfordi]|uniref:Uncharacterized protein n=1 Tax=Podarcis lilfordi TaxID=74358 RepID=A0AA35PA71_9SAUR|nr:Hypothetical predicted protein [Podarcis lilfordi]
MERYPGCCQLSDVIFNCNATSPPGLVQNSLNEASVLLAASLLALRKAKGLLHKSIFAGAAVSLLPRFSFGSLFPPDKACIQVRSRVGWTEGEEEQSMRRRLTVGLCVPWVHHPC